MAVNPDDNGPQLAIEEYKYVRDMLKTNIDIMEKNESLILLAMAAVYGFLIKDLKVEFGIVTVVGLVVPAALSVFGYMRYKALDKVIGLHNDYLEGIEGKYPKNLGWTKAYRSKKLGPTETSLKTSRDIFWWSLIIGSFAIFFFVNALSFCKI